MEVCRDVELPSSFRSVVIVAMLGSHVELSGDGGGGEGREGREEGGGGGGGRGGGGGGGGGGNREKFAVPVPWGLGLRW